MAKFEIRINEELFVTSQVSELDQMEINLVNLAGSDSTVLTISSCLPEGNLSNWSTYSESICLCEGDVMTISVMKNEIESQTYISEQAEIEDVESTIFCSFCGKGNVEIKKMVSGNESNICNECVDLASEVVKNEK